jgi:hypothetical protein
MAENTMAQHEKDWFCQNWDTAKKALQLVGTVSKNIFVRICIAVLVAAGDKLSESICKE